ncbi:MAG: hypothetical protein Sapg2KO_41900 [Saprospiraceae bacterium]
MSFNRRNDRNNYLQAVPDYPECIDWIKLISRNKNLSPNQTWETLYLHKGVLNLSLSEDDPLSHQLYHLYFEQQNQKKLQQITPLHIGTPMLIWSTDQGLRSAPLLLLPVEIHPKFDKKGQWTVQVASQTALFANPLINFQGVEDTFWEKLKLKLPNLDTLSQLAALLGAEVGTKDDWTLFPSSKNWPSHIDHKALLPSMVLGIFDSPEKHKEYSFDHPELIEPIAKWRHQFTIADLDPNQRALFDNSQNEAISIATGGPGTGKKHLTEALLVNALSNQKKILFITGKPANIPNLQSYLDHHKLGHLSFWLRRADQDLSLLLALLSNPVKVDHLFANEQQLKQWQKETDELQQFKQRYDSAFRAVKKPTFGSFDWSQTVGLYLKAQKQAGKAILSSELNQSSFQFDSREHESISKVIHKAQILFEPVKSIRHPLRALNPNVFLSLAQDEAFDFTNNQLSFFLDQLTKLQQQYIQFTNKYKQRLNDYFENHYRQQLRQVEDLELAIANNITAYGRDFELSSKTSLQFIGAFSRRIKKIAAERNRITSLYQQLLKGIKPMPELNVALPAATQQISVRQISAFLAEYKASLIDWKKTTPHLIEQHLKRLEYQNAIAPLGLQANLIDLETRLDQIVEELNLSNLLADTQSQPMLTLPKRQQKTEQLMDFLENLQINLSHFPTFYQWQHFWLQQNDNNQALIKAIIRAKPKNWINAFENWYLQQLLTKNQATALPQQDFSAYEALSKLRSIQQNLAKQINFIWEPARQDLAKFFRKNQKQLNQKANITKVFSEHGKSITAAIPLFFSTSVNAVKCFSEINYPIFDLIIFDSAQFIDEKLGRHLQRLGKQQIIIGNDQFIHNDEKADYLEFALQQNQEQIKLNKIHKYYPANLFQLLNGASITEKAMKSYKVKAIQLSGDYHEGLGINSAEVHYIIQFLQQLDRSALRTYPKIAIVCNTIKQRDYISKAILKIKKDGSYEEKDNFLQMERNGLMVLHLSELEASRFELLLYSFTYGNTKNKPSYFTTHAGILNTAAGLRQLNELMSTASNEVQIIHSLNEDIIKDWAHSEDKQGYFLLANYIRMIQAIDQSDSSFQKTITQHFQSAYPEESAQTDQLPIYDEITAALQQQLPDAILYQNFQKAHLKVPLLVQHPTEVNQQLAVIVDYFLVQTKATDFNWEINRRKRLQQSGIQIITTYSIDWWKHPEKATLDLVDKIKLIWAEGK